MAPPDLEGLLECVGGDDVHHAGGVLIQVEALQDHVVVVLAGELGRVNEAVLLAVGLEHVGVRGLADLALKRLPVVGADVRRFLALPLRLYPLLQAEVMYILYSSFAPAAGEQWVYD